MLSDICANPHANSILDQSFVLSFDVLAMSFLLACCLSWLPNTSGIWGSMKKMALQNDQGGGTGEERKIDM